MPTIQTTINAQSIFMFRSAVEALPKDIKKLHAAKAGQATIAARRILEASILRPQERGFRPEARLTGMLFGPRRKSVHGRAFKDGPVSGWGFPDVAELDRFARHWRALEFGLPASRHFLPGKGFIDGGGNFVPPRSGTSGDRFIPGQGASTKGSGIAAKNFLRGGFEEVQRTMPKAYQKVIGFRLRRFLKRS